MGTSLKVSIDKETRRVEWLASAIAAACLEHSLVKVDLTEMPKGVGYAVQDRVREKLGRSVAGYRIVANSERARRQLGTTGPLVGLIFEDFECKLSRPTRRPSNIEGEFAVEVEFYGSEREYGWKIRGWRLALDLPASRQKNLWSSFSADQIVGDLGLLGNIRISERLAIPHSLHGAGTMTIESAGALHTVEVPLPTPEGTKALLDEIAALIRDRRLARATGRALVLLGAEH